MKLEMKKLSKGIFFNCPIKNCLYKVSSAGNFYDHLKIVHNFYWFGEKK